MGQVFLLWLKSTSPSQGVRTPGHYLCRCHFPCDFGQVHSLTGTIICRSSSSIKAPKQAPLSLSGVGGCGDPTEAGRCRWERELPGAGVTDPSACPPFKPSAPRAAGRGTAMISGSFLSTDMNDFLRPFVGLLGPACRSFPLSSSLLFPLPPHKSSCPSLPQGHTSV